MAGNISPYAENKLLEHVLGRTTFVKPTAVSLGLATATPTEGSFLEVTAGDYVRQAISWNAAASGEITNSGVIRFPVSGTAASAWGTILGFGIFDVASGGNLLWYGPVSPSVTIGIGDVIQFDAGQISVTLD